MTMLIRSISRAAAFLFALLLTNAAAAAESAVRYVQSALVIDVATRAVLYAHREHERVDPASLVKMMVTLLAVERIERGELSLDDTYTVSAAASRIGGHQIYLKHREEFPLRDLLKSVVIASANDAAFAVAEHIAGSQEAFVSLMNSRAQQLGMRDTRFANAHGLPPNRRKGQQANYTTAHDLAILATALMKYPQVRAWAATRLESVRGGAFQLLNTNQRFLQGFAGADGFKTGYHPRGAGFSVVATATREGRSLLAVVLGAPSGRARLAAATQLLELGFADKLHMSSMTAAAASSMPGTTGTH
ncbi:MAG: D-alanyl-D-alanine carboxypeptidase [Gammaproteobacteria bacterium]|nr:D-alanyl-D-alanine carboxypeptidase [Gammaproteobacteria bacterium]